jgi:signal transduction histidine kinase
MREHMATAAELTRAAKEAERAGTAKGDFLAKISHELRTPLNAVIGYSEMLLEDMAAGGESESVSDVKKIHSAGHFLLKLVNEVLDLSKIEAGKMDVHTEAVDLPGLIESIGERYRALARQNDLDFVVECGPALGKIRTDPSKLEHAIGQLIDNAIKYTHHGRITLSAGLDAGPKRMEAKISVRDTGVGIAAERFDSLFEQFNLDGDTSASKYGGTGLGLALSQKISRLLGGDLVFESKLNVGSCFTIKIPVDAQQAGEDDRVVGEAIREAEAFHQQLRRLVGRAKTEGADASGKLPGMRAAVNG